MSVVRLWVFECCKVVGGTSCELEVGMGGRGSFKCMSVVRWWVVLPVGWGQGMGGRGSL